MMKVIKFLREWFELILIPIAVLAFIYFPKLLGDDIYSQAAWGALYLQKLLYAVLIVIVGNALAYVTVKLNNNYTKESPHKEWLELVSYCVLLLSFVLATLSL